MRRAIAVLGLVAGCTHSTVVTAPDGQWAYQVRCKRSEACADECTRLCPKGYWTLAYATNAMMVRCRGGELGGKPTD